MDLLDLELDLNGEGGTTSSPGRATRKNRGSAATTATVPTPKSQAKKSATPAAPKSVSTPKTATQTPKAAPKKTPAAKTPNPAVEVATTTTSVKKTPAAKRTPARKPVVDEDASEEMTPAVVKEEPVEAESTSQQTPRGRSPSLARSRHQPKKRFSPSPVAKRRKTMTGATPTTTPSATVAASPKNKKKAVVAPATPAPLDPQVEFNESIRRLREVINAQGPQAYDIPEEWKNMAIEDSDNEGEEMPTLVAAPSTSSQTPKNTGKKTAAATAKKEQTSAIRGRMSTSTSAPEDVVTPESEPKKEAAKPKKEATDKRRSTKKIEVVEKKKIKEEDEEYQMDEESPESSSEERLVVSKKSRRKSVPTKKVKEEVAEGDEGGPSTSEPNVNPNSALAIKKRLMGEPKASPKSSAAEKKGVKKAPATPAPVKEEEPEEAPEDVQDAPGPAPPASAATVATVAPVAPTPTPKAKKEKPADPATSTPVAILPTPTRASGRVSKPNRLYNDVSFNTDFLGRTRITEQNPAKEAQAKEATPDPQPLPSYRRKSLAPPSATRPPPTPKPIPVINGVQRGYVPSKKTPLADHEVDGVVVKLNDEVNDVVDVLMLKVCKDGVVKHEDIDPKVVKAKTKAKMDSAKRVKLEARKLNITMNTSGNSPSTSEDLGKRKRQAPKSIDDIYYMPPMNRKAAATPAKEKSTSREATPLDDEEDVEMPDARPADDKRQQKARRSISHLFDEEMDASIKEAKSFSVRFDAYIKPKIQSASKNARIKLMSRKRQSADPDDFYYHEMLTDQVSPSTSNVENEGGEMMEMEQEEDEIDVLGIDEEPEAEITQGMSIAIRTEALDTAEQIVVFVPRQTKHDGSPMPLDHLHVKAMEHLESRKLCLTETLPIVVAQFTHESSQLARNAQEIGCMWHTVTTSNAQDLKNLFAMTDTVREDAICWTHLFLLENLPVNYLASYLSVLRYAKRTDPIRMGYIINSTKDEETDAEWVNITDIVKAFSHKKFTEPGTEVLKNTIPLRRFENTVFLLVPPTLTLGDQRHHLRQQYGRIFRWLQSIGHADSETLSIAESPDASCSVAEYLSDIVVDRICEKVRQKRTEKPNLKVVLVGYGSSTYMVHRAVNLISGVSAIISIGFPVMSPLGRRGTSEDEILLTYCPTLFIVGAHGQRFNNQAMAELRNAMQSPTGLLVLGHANDLLLVPTYMLLRLGISQTVIYRMVLEKILDFLNIPAVRDHQNVSELVPRRLHDIHDLDQSLLKGDKGLSGLAFASTPSSPLASPVAASGRRATVSGVEDTNIKKKREPAHHPLLSNTSSLGGAGGPLTPSPRSGGDSFLAFQNLMTSTTTTADDMPRRSSMGASPRVVERGDFRDHHRAVHRPAAQQPQRPSPRGGPLDPASISLA